MIRLFSEIRVIYRDPTNGSVIFLYRIIDHLGKTIMLKLLVKKRREEKRREEKRRGGRKIDVCLLVFSPRLEIGYLICMHMYIYISLL